MRLLLLTQGKVATVSNCDYAHVAQWKWCYKRNDKTQGGYAIRRGPRPRRRYISLHVVIAERMGLIGRIDHRNQNELDNRRSNLRQCNLSQNQGNSHMRRNNTSGYRGVSRSRNATKWLAQITVHGINKCLGHFDSKVEAARAYNIAAKKHFGKFATLNRISSVVQVETA
jgi:hypothetical protein